MMDKFLVKSEAANKLRGIGDPTTPDELEEACDYLIRTLTEIADTVVPKRKPSAGKGCDWWCAETAKATAEASRLGRRYRATQSQSA